MGGLTKFRHFRNARGEPKRKLESMATSQSNSLALSQIRPPTHNVIPRGLANADTLSEDDEAEDNFQVDDSPRFLLDLRSLAMISNSARPGPPSVATTVLASAVGSVVGEPKDAFLKSLTFFKATEQGWAIQFQEHTERPRGWGQRSKQRLCIDSVGGLVTLSRIQNGDYLRSINNQKVGPSMNAESALEQMNWCLENEGVLSVATTNKELGDDILIQATIIKSSPDMKYENMGMEVWFWGYLCIRKIEKDSVFSHTVLRDTDHVISINDIQCDRLRPKQFAEILDSLPFEVTITVLRRKQRWGGKFG